MSCWFCGQSSGGPLVRACACRGNQWEWVHTDCLAIYRSALDPAPHGCLQCGAPYLLNHTSQSPAARAAAQEAAAEEEEAARTAAQEAAAEEEEAARTAAQEEAAEEEEAARAAAESVAAAKAAEEEPAVAGPGRRWAAQRAELWERGTRKLAAQLERLLDEPSPPVVDGLLALPDELLSKILARVPTQLLLWPCAAAAGAVQARLGRGTWLCKLRAAGLTDRPPPELPAIRRSLAAARQAGAPSSVAVLLCGKRVRMLSCSNGRACIQKDYEPAVEAVQALKELGTLQDQIW